MYKLSVPSLLVVLEWLFLMHISICQALGWQILVSVARQAQYMHNITSVKN